MNIVFLDINGVIQPDDTEDRFYEYSLKTKKYIADLSEKYGVDYHQYNFIDVLSTCFDWNDEAIGRVKWVLDKCNAKIIVTSDWRREKQPNKMPDLFKIHGLDKYWFADNITLKKQGTFEDTRALEITDSLNRYNIDNYVIFEDKEGLREYFPSKTIITHNYISLDDANEAVKILTKTR